jgi:hypothetical protein
MIYLHSVASKAYKKAIQNGYSNTQATSQACTLLRLRGLSLAQAKQITENL